MKGKIAFPLFISFFISLAAHAGTVSLPDAQTVAVNFFKIATGQQRTYLSANLKYQRHETDGIVSLYVFDINPVKGFVIVSASDLDIPVIGYSTESYFGTDFSRTGLNEWLGRWGEEISYAETNQILVQPKALVLWNCYRQGIAPAMEKSAGVAPLCSTTWSQSGAAGQIPAIYNEDCPYDVNASTNALTGCVATAMAQIMKYWNYPPLGTGIASYSDEQANGFSNNYGQLSFNFNTTPFNWASMPDSLTANSTPAQDSAVSLLNYACGVAVEMDYGPTESGAWCLTSESPIGASSQQAYPQYFKYDAYTIQGIVFTDYTVEAWIEMIENELNLGRPVQYEGNNVTEGGHTWVCDGYNTSDMMHMNWGWGGQYNGWFAVTNLDPSYSFTYNLKALIGIQPGVEAIATPPAVCAGDTAQLSITGGPVTATYSWSPSLGLSCSNCPNPKASPGVTTTYTVAIDSAGYNITRPVTVYVSQPHILSYTLSDSLICQGNAAILQLTGVSGVSISPAVSVSWQDSLSALLAPDSTISYLIYTQSSVCHTADTASIAIHVTPYTPVTISLSADTICSGSTATLTYNGLTNVEVTPSNYSYSGGNNIVALDPVNTTFFSVAGLTSCGSIYTDTFTLTVSQGSDSLSYSISRSTLCSGDTAVLTILNATGVQVIPANAVTTVGNNVFLLTPDSNTTFYVTGYYPACGGQASAKVPVKVTQPDSLNAAVGIQDICAGGYEYVYLYGVTGDILCSPFLNFYFNDSTDAYAYFVADSTLTYNISATTVCGVTGNANVQVKVLQVVSYNLQQAGICQGDSTLFTVAGLSSINIYPTTGFDMIDSGHYWFHPAVTTSYNLYGYDCTGAYNNNSFTVYVVQPGILDYTVTDTNLCSAQGARVQLNGVTDPQISPSGNLLAIDPADYYADLYPTVATTYTISGESVCGGAAEASFTVHVYPQAGYLLGTSAVCPGGSTTLTIHGLTDPSVIPTASVQWLNDSVVRLSPSTETEYELSGNDCTGGIVTYNVLVSVLAGTAVTYSVDSELCNGGESYLSITGASDIALYPAANIFYTDSFDAYAYLMPTGSTTYALQAVSECTGAEVSDTFNVYVAETPTYKLSSTAVCNNDTVIIEAIGLNDMAINPAYNLNYLNNNVALLYPAVTTIYTISGTSSCTNQSYSQQFTITADTAPTGAALNISVSNDTLYAPSAGGYQWMLNGTAVSGANLPYIVPAGDGVYTVQLSFGAGCIVTSNPFSYSAINSINKIAGCYIYPNPSSDTWILNGPPQAAGARYDIYDATGQLIHRSLLNSLPLRLDINLASGIYLLKIYATGQPDHLIKLIKL